MRHHLLLDADDTLWENNVYFERATHYFITFLNHSSLSREEVRAVLDDVERLIGYGSANYTRSLVETFRRLVSGTSATRISNKCAISVSGSARIPCSCWMASGGRSRISRPAMIYFS